MSWNDSGNKDPWSGKQQPPDLEEALKKFQKQLKAWLKGKNKLNGSQPFTSKEIKSPNPHFLSFVGLGAFVLWVLSGIFIVNPAEQAAILYFGKYAETLNSGPHWVPTFIAKKVVMNVDRVSDYAYSGQMLTKDENLVSVSIVVRYRIGNLEAYLFNVSDPEESLRQATSSALRQVVGTTTLDELITAGREVWAGQVQESLAVTLERYNLGIKIISVAPQAARAPEHVQSAFDDAIKAQEDERRFIEQARAYEAKVVPIAEGQAKRIYQESEAFAQQVVLNAQGQTSEFLQLLPQYMQAPKIMAERLYVETMEKIMAQNPKIFVDTKQAPNLYMPFLRKMFQEKPEQALAVDQESQWRQPNATETTSTDSSEDLNNSRMIRGFRRTE